MAVDERGMDAVNDVVPDFAGNHQKYSYISPVCPPQYGEDPSSFLKKIAEVIAWNRFQHSTTMLKLYRDAPEQGNPVKEA